MKKQLTEYNRLKKRTEKYGCSGFCYGGIDEFGNEHDICGGIDICDETRIGEFWATILAVLVILLIPIVAIIGFGYIIYYYVITGGGL